MRIKPKSQEHRYAARLEWTGSVGTAPMEYATYGRSYRVRVEGKPELIGSADPVFRGDASKFNPEDLLVISVAGCHMLTYLALCARRGVTVLAYEDEASGTLEVHSGDGGKFVEITLHPVVTISEDSDEALALELHHPAHERCFIANSCSVPIRYEATIRTAAASTPKASPEP